jgi:hypothetical protein
MSTDPVPDGGEISQDTGANAPSTELRSVGYRSPPVEHRFRKGQSGNPKGRPRKPKVQYELPHGMHGPSDRLGSRLLLEEAYRPVVVREGDKVIELPAIQAVFRAMNVSAMKGNRFAQKMVAEMVANVEEEHRIQESNFFESIASYKMYWEQEIARCRARGLPEPSPVPHPADIRIDVRSGRVQVEGPFCEDEKAKWDKLLARRAEAQEEVTYCATEYRRTRSRRMKEILFQDWIAEQKIFDIINDKMPERYKATLENRSYLPGATRQGAAIALR